jgi:hypothetical protein
VELLWEQAMEKKSISLRLQKEKIKAAEGRVLPSFLQVPQRMEDKDREEKRHFHKDNLRHLPQPHYKDSLSCGWIRKGKGRPGQEKKGKLTNC